MDKNPRVEPLKAWALVEAKKSRGGYDARICGGDYRISVFWTLARARKARQLRPECVIVPVVVNQVFG